MPIGGTSYQPGAQMQGMQPRPAVSPQEAVRLLNLRLPKHAPNAPIPQQLMTSQGGGGLGSLTALLQALMRAQGGGGSREMVSDAEVPAIDTGLSSDIRRFDFRPRINIGDAGERERVGGDPPPAPTEPAWGLFDDTPYFDAGIPRVRRAVVGAQPLF
jgi:hypothetical protein